MERPHSATSKNFDGDPAIDSTLTAGERDGTVVGEEVGVNVKSKSPDESEEAQQSRGVESGRVLMGVVLDDSCLSVGQPPSVDRVPRKGWNETSKEHLSKQQLYPSGQYAHPGDPGFCVQSSIGSAQKLKSLFGTQNPYCPFAAQVGVQPPLVQTS